MQQPQKQTTSSSSCVFFMELHFQSFYVILAFLLFVFMVLKISKRSKAEKLELNLPPGPWRLPVIGNMHQLVGSLPHLCLRDLAKRYGPFMHLKLGEINTIVVSSPEFAREVMKIHDTNFANRPFLLAASVLSYDSKCISFSPYGEYWRQLRKICTLELLSSKRVQSFRPIREEEASNFIKYVASHAGSVVNLSEKLIASTYGVTARAAFGEKCKDQEEFISLVKEAIEVVAGFSVADVFPSLKWLHTISGMMPKIEQIHRRIDRILENIITEHKTRSPTKGSTEGELKENLVDVLLKFHQDHGDCEFCLTNDNIKAVILDIFAAGSETSSTTVEWALSEMLRDSRVLKKAQSEVRQVFSKKGKVEETDLEELKYLKLVIKETLRLHPPAPLILPRECREKCEINGYKIPAKTKVIVNAFAIGRDPRYWLEAERFYPERFLDSSVDYKGANFEFIPFGAGRRICPGMTFGIASMELPLANLLYHFDWKSPDGQKLEDLDMSESFGVTVRRKNDLYLIPMPYNPLPVE